MAEAHGTHSRVFAGSIAEGGMLLISSPLAGIHFFRTRIGRFVKVELAHRGYAADNGPTRSVPDANTKSYQPSVLYANM